jgi:hypothetical protein
LVPACERSAMPFSAPSAPPRDNHRRTETRPNPAHVA